MYHIRPYKVYELNIESENRKEISGDQLKFLESYVNGKWEIDEYGFVNVEGNVNCSKSDISNFSGIRFGRVTGYFDCSHNNIESLDGCPLEVFYTFNCSYNPIKSLKGSPKKCWHFISDNCKNLKSLEGSPETVTGNFICSDCGMESIFGSPEIIRLSFDCSNNRIKSLIGGPKKVGENYNCSYNELENLEGFPLLVGKNLNLSNNKIKSFIGFPEKTKDFRPSLAYNKIDFSNNPIKEKYAAQIFREMSLFGLGFEESILKLKKMMDPHYYSDMVKIIDPDIIETVERLEKYEKIKKFI